MVPVNGLSVKSGRDTIEALAELFASLRAEGVSGLCVWSGTLSADEQAAAQARQRSATRRKCLWRKRCERRWRRIRPYPPPSSGGTIPWKSA